MVYEWVNLKQAKPHSKFHPWKAYEYAFNYLAHISACVTPSSSHLTVCYNYA